MKYEEISETMRLFMGAREMFRKIGFSADDLFCEVARSVVFHGLLSCFCTLKTQGKSFRVLCGPIPNQDEEAFGREYKAICAAAASGNISQEDADRIWQESEPFADKVGFLRAIQSKGFRIPKQGN